LLVALVLGAFVLSSQVRQLFPPATLAEAQEGSLNEDTTSGISSFVPELFFNIPATMSQLLTAAVLAVEGESSFGGAAQFAGPVGFVQDVVIDGKLTLNQSITGTNIDIDLQSGKVIASNLVYSVVGGSGMAVSGDQDLVLENTDKGSAQNIFKKIQVGDQTIEADSNSDELSLQAGSGITLSRSGDEITIAGATDSGWERPAAGVVALVTANDKVGIGTASPSNTLEIASQVDGLSGLTFTNLTAGATAGVGGGKVLTVDSGGKVILVQDQTGSTPNAEDILPGTESGGTLYFNGLNWVSTTNLYHDGGSVGISTDDPQGRLHVLSNATGTRGLIVQGMTGQTANLQEWRDGAGSVVAAISPTGGFSGKIDGSVAFTGLSDGILSMNSGSLASLSTLGASYITPDSLDFSQFKNAMSLEADTNINVTNSRRLTVTSDLSLANRSGPVFKISQPNNASYTVSGSSNALVEIENLDTDSHPVLLDLKQSGQWDSLRATPGTDSRSAAILLSGVTSARGIRAYGESVTSGSVLDLSTGGVGLWSSGSFSGSLIKSQLSRILSGGNVAFTESGRYLDIGRSNITHGVGSVMNHTNELVRFSSDCYKLTVNGTCNDSSRILLLDQKGIYATGNVLEVLNAGTGNAVQIGGAGARSINSTAGNLSLKTTTSGNVIVNSAGTIELEDNTNITGGLAVTGNISSINGLSYTWPSSHTTNGILTNSGDGTLSWGTISSSMITADSLDFSEFKDAMTLDASTSIAAGNVFGLTLVSDLTSGNRGPASPVLSISQADNATYNNTTSAGLLSVTNSDTGSSGIVAHFVQNGTGQGVYISGTTTSGLLTISPNVTGKAIQIFSEHMTTGSVIKLDNGGTTIATSLTFSGDIISARPSKYLTGGSAVLTESGNYLDIRRDIATASVGSIANITGDLAILESSCNVSFNAGTCNDSATILSVAQLYANATGDVLELTNVGSGDALELLGAGSRSINSTSGNFSLKTTTSGNVIVNSAGTIELEDNTNVTGDLNVTGACTGCSSDIRLKQDVQSLSGSSLQKLLSLRGVSFSYSDPEKAKYLSGKQLGVIAQDVEAVFPELVGTDSRGFKFVRYDHLIAPTIEAIREQQTHLLTLDNSLLVLNSTLALKQLNPDGSLTTLGVDPHQTELEARLAALELQVEELASESGRLQATGEIPGIARWLEGSWKFMADVVFAGKARFDQAVTFLADVSFGGRVSYEDLDTAGVITFQTNESIAEVTFDTPYETKPIITLALDNYEGKYKLDVTQTGFTIRLTSAAEEQLSVNWIAVNAKNAKQTTAQVADEAAEQTTFQQESGQTNGEQPTLIPTPSSASLLDAPIAATMAAVVLP